MAGEMGTKVVEVTWVANPFRGDKFAEHWAPIAELALDYGAHAYAFFRSVEDRPTFTQLSFFETKDEWERYWYGDPVSEARMEASGLFQVPILPAWHAVVQYGTRPVSAAAQS